MPEQRESCGRCGTCCRNGPPGLHTEDGWLYRQGRVKKEELLTLRKGERVYDNIRDKNVLLAEELVRIRSKKNESACLFFDGSENRCEIYEFRPVECRVLTCWDSSGILEIYAENRLSRKDLFPQGSALGQIIEEHEKNCPYARVGELVDRINGGREPETKDLEELAAMIRLDLGMRTEMQDKTGAGGPVLEFLFGRSLLKTLPGFGLEVRETVEGYRFFKHK